MKRFLIVFALVATSSAAAHEIGTTRVEALFRKDHTYRIDVVTGPQSLLNKLEAKQGLPRSPMLPPTLQRARLNAMRGEFMKHVDIRFGDVRVTPRVEILPNDTVRLAGDLPSRSGDFTWHYGLTFASYVISMQNEGHGALVWQWLDGDGTSTPFALARDVIPPTRMEVVRQYLALGFTHIVPHGLDHILFVLGIFLLTTKLKPVLMQVTAFTIAHSITLGLTIYGVVSLSPRIVEPAIAISIAWIAVENITTTELRPWRVAIVFAFGLLHGMGFAGVLRELGLPRSEFLTALVTFNVGVELGQLTVIATAFVLFAYWYRMKPWYRRWFVVPASAAIAATGLFWTVQRIVG